MSPWDWLMNPAGLTAHGFCLSWAPGLVALHAGSDALIGLAYFSIPLALGALARAKPEVRYGGLVYLFIAFILACGATHFMSIFTLWVPAYGVEGIIKALTAGLSIATAVLMWPLVPQLIAMPTTVELARLNGELTAKIAEQERTAALLLESEERVRAANRDLEQRVEDKTAEIKAANERLKGIVDSAMDALITVDDQQKIVLFNPAAARMFQIESEGALGASLDSFIPERFREGHPEHILAFKNARITTRRMGALRSVSGLRANGEEFPMEASISQVEAGGAKLATVIMRDITERQATEAARQLLAEEVDHRAKNALAIVQAVVSLTQAPTKEAFVQAVGGRIEALARAHSLLAENRWRGGDLVRIIADEVAPYQKPGQLTIRGSSVAINPQAVQSIGLILHELATNALKYGALSNDSGHVEVDLLLLENRDLRLRWTETGGPAVRSPLSTGFGATLITQIASRQLGGGIDLEWLPGGLVVTALLPAATYRRILPPEPSAADLSPADSPNDDPRLLTVLVVEDELLISLQLCEEFRAIGWRIVGPASTVEEALRLLDEAWGIDAAVVDINLAGHLAYPVADRLQALGIPFIFYTGFEQPTGVERFEASTIVRKPVDISVLIQKLSRLPPAA